MRTGMELQNLTWPKGTFLTLRSASFDQRGKYVFLAGNEGGADMQYPHIWHAETGKLINPSFWKQVSPYTTLSGNSSARFSPTSSRDGYWCLMRPARYGGPVDLRRARNGFRITSLLGHPQDLIHSAVFSRDGRSVVTAGQDHTARIWTDFPGELPCPKKGYWPGSGWFRGISNDDTAALSRDGRWLLTGFDPREFQLEGQTRSQGVLWDLTTGRKAASLIQRDAKGNFPLVYFGSFSPDGKTALVGTKREARIFEVPSGKQLASFPAEEDIADLRFDPTGKRVLIHHVRRGSSGSVWDVGTKKRLFSLPVDVRKVAFSPDGNHVAVADRMNRVKLRVRVLDSATGKETLVLTPKKSFGRRWTSLESHPTGKWLMGPLKMRSTSGSGLRGNLRASRPPRVRSSPSRSRSGWSTVGYNRA